MAATLKDIARFAHVAPSTASYVLGGTGLHKVGKETQRRIFEAAAKLDYRRNINAQGLSTGRSFMVGVLIQQLSTSFLPEVLEGVEEELQRHNYGILLTSFTTPDELKKKCAYLDSRCVDGVLVVAISGVKNYSQLGKLYDRQLPAVALMGALDGVPAVLVDPVAIGALAIEYLHDRGHRRIAYCGAAESPRLDGVRRRAAAFGDVELCVQPYSWQSGVNGARAFDWLREQTPQPSAVIAESDRQAMELVCAAQRAGWILPEALSVLGVDGTDIGELISPAITSIGQPTVEQGRRAAEMILRRINGAPVDNHIFQPFIVERESCTVLA